MVFAGGGDELKGDDDLRGNKKKEDRDKWGLRTGDPKKNVVYKTKILWSGG